MLTLAAEGAASLKSMAFTELVEGSNTVINPPLMRERQREKEKQTNNKNYYYFTLLFQTIQDIQSPHIIVPQWQHPLPILLPAVSLRPSSNISNCQLLWHLKTTPINHTRQNLEPIVFTCGRSWSWKKKEKKNKM